MTTAPATAAVAARRCTPATCVTEEEGTAECWTAEHPDGSLSFGHPSEQIAADVAARWPSARDIPRTSDGSYILNPMAAP